MIASHAHCTLIWECAEGIALFWQETETVCCWVLVHLNWNGVKTGQMVSQISTRPLWFWVVSLAFLSFMHFRSYNSHHLAGALSFVSKFWLCWGGMQPDAASTIGFTLVGCLPFGWGLPECCLESQFPGLWWERLVFWDGGDFGEIWIQPLHFSERDPEFQGGGRNRSRSYSELVVGAYIHPFWFPLGVLSTTWHCFLAFSLKDTSLKTLFLTLELYVSKRQKEKHTM